MGTRSVQWYDPLRRGELQEGTASTLTGPGKQDIGYPLQPITGDPVALVRRIDQPEAINYKGCPVGTPDLKGFGIYYFV